MFRPSLGHRFVIWEPIPPPALFSVASQVAQTKGLTKAFPCVLAVDGLHAEDDVPHVLQDTTADYIIKLGFHEPITNPLVLFLRPGSDAGT